MFTYTWSYDPQIKATGGPPNSGDPPFAAAAGCGAGRTPPTAWPAVRSGDRTASAGLGGHPTASPSRGTPSRGLCHDGGCRPPASAQRPPFPLRVDPAGRRRDGGTPRAQVDSVRGSPRCVRPPAPLDEGCQGRRLVRPRAAPFAHAPGAFRVRRGRPPEGPAGGCCRGEAKGVGTRNERPGSHLVLVTGIMRGLPLVLCRAACRVLPRGRGSGCPVLQSPWPRRHRGVAAVGEARPIMTACAETLGDAMAGVAARAGLWSSDGLTGPRR